MYNPQFHNRHSIRLKGYDYSQAGLYFVTIVCQNRMTMFGNVQNGEMILNDAGRMVAQEWENLPLRFPQIQLHEYVVMPNHFHAILEITNNERPNGEIVVGARPCGCLLSDNNGRPDNERHDNEMIDEGEGTHKGCPDEGHESLGEILGAFQSIVTVNYIRNVKNNSWTPFNKKLWQRNYYEHIIRNEQSYNNISNYIQNNPRNWNDDTLKITTL